MNDVRETLGVLGELVSHVDQVINLKNYEIMKSLSMRYLIIEIGSVLRIFCSSLPGVKDFSSCVDRVSRYLGNDKAELIDEIIRLRERLIEGGSVNEAYLYSLLLRVGDLYVALERGIVNFG